MTKVNLHEAKARMAHYTRLVKAGETIILCDRNKPFAEIRPIGDSLKPAKPRALGLMKGMCPVDAGFFAADSMLSDDFANGGIFPEPATDPAPR